MWDSYNGADRRWVNGPCGTGAIAWRSGVHSEKIMVETGWLRLRLGFGCKHRPGTAPCGIAWHVRVGTKFARKGLEASPLSGTTDGGV